MPPDWMRYPNLASDDDADSSDIMHLVTDFDPSITFDDLALFGEWSGLPVVVKGLLRGDDAARAVDAGAAAIAVSNHGGRVLDGIAATADVLLDVVDAVAGRAEVYVDGGIRQRGRRGQGARTRGAGGDGRTAGALGSVRRRCCGGGDRS